MAQKSLNLNDKRCLKTRAAVEDALFDYYATHSHFEKLPIVKLCKNAKVSTPVFYRHYRGIADVVEAKDLKIRTELAEFLGEVQSFSICLVRLFRFFQENSDYYGTNIHQNREQPFFDIAELLNSRTMNFIKTIRPANRSRRVNNWVCYEIEYYVIAELKWWGNMERCDPKMSDRRIDEIIIYAKQRVQDMEQRLSTGRQV